MRNKTVIVLLVVVLVVAFAGCVGCTTYVNTYNGLVTADETVEAAWGNVQSAYQRRLDLIPNLVNTVQGAADFEQETQTRIAELRSQATEARSDFQQGTIEEQQAVAARGEQLLRQFLLIVENYPQLRATEAFRDLQVQLEGTENRINVERNRYNEAVRAYNTKVRRFPASIVAGIAGFERRPLFEADEGAEQAPQVDFNS